MIFPFGNSWNKLYIRCIFLYVNPILTEFSLKNEQQPRKENKNIFCKIVWELWKRVFYKYL